MHSDPVADLLTRLRNANMVRHTEFSIPASNVKEDVLKVLQSEGYIDGFSREQDDTQGHLLVRMRYLSDRTRVIRHIKRVSKPGRRVYCGAKEMPKVQNGLGIAIVSTNQGVITDREARKRNVGGEVLCEVW